MIQDMGIFKLYSAMARHAAGVQSVSAENISRAAEPGYKAKAVESFEAFVERTKALETNTGQATAFSVFEANTPAAPNGNTVSLEQEMLQSAQAAGQHNMALTVYSKSLDIMRLALGRGR